MRIQYCTLFNDLKMKAQDFLFVHRYCVKKLLLVILSFLNARCYTTKYFNPYNKNLKYKIKIFLQLQTCNYLLFILVMENFYTTARTNIARCTFIHRVKGLSSEQHYEWELAVFFFTTVYEVRFKNEH